MGVGVRDRASFSVKVGNVPSLLDISLLVGVQQALWSRKTGWAGHPKSSSNSSHCIPPPAPTCVLVKFRSCLLHKVNFSFHFHVGKEVKCREVSHRKGSSVVLPLSMALVPFQLPLGPWQGTEMVSGVELPLSTAVGTLQLPTGP